MEKGELIKNKLSDATCLLIVRLLLAKTYIHLATNDKLVCNSFAENIETSLVLSLAAKLKHFWDD